MLENILFIGSAGSYMVVLIASFALWAMKEYDDIIGED